MLSKNKSERLIFAALFLALAIVLPFLTGQIPAVGKMLLPMHIPVLLCGFFCGPVYGLAVGIIAPLMRSLLFGAPELFPMAIAMCAELAAYGAASSLLYKALPKKKPLIYVSLAGAMIVGRVCYTVADVFLTGVYASPAGWATVFVGSFTGGLLGIALQLLLIPPIVMILEKHTDK